VSDDFFIPRKDEVRSQVGKPGSYTFRVIDGEIAANTVDMIDEANNNAYASYKKLLEMGVAKELARTVLPVSMYTQFYWTVNARSLMNFLSLRLAESAQLDIRNYAKSVELIFADKMPTTYKIWIENGKICP
jgi:thymidylate synthase (FAD)